MRVSWLQPQIVKATRAELLARTPNWEDHFDPEFHAGPAPDGVPDAVWPRAAEHVARAERVSMLARTHGLAFCIARFEESPHAIELATVVAAAAHIDSVTLDLLELLFRCEVDELVAYGEFLALLGAVAGQQDRVIALYEHFCTAAERVETDQVHWEDRVNAIRDGLASFYVKFGRHEDGHDIFLTRHKRCTDDLTVALAAARSFLAAGAVARAVHWLGLGAERARGLGRPAMERTLLEKQRALRKRLS